MSDSVIPVQTHEADALEQPAVTASMPENTVTVPEILTTVKVLPPIPPVKPPCLFQRLKARGFSSFVGKQRKTITKSDNNSEPRAEIEPDPESIKPAHDPDYEDINFSTKSPYAELIFTTSCSAVEIDSSQSLPANSNVKSVEISNSGTTDECGSTSVKQVQCPALVPAKDVEKPIMPDSDDSGSDTPTQLPLPRRPSVEGDESSDGDDIEPEEETYENTVIVKNSQEFVVERTPGIPSLSAALGAGVKYKVHQSPAGVTTISIDRQPPPVIHHVINLPPRRVNFLKKRRRKTEDLSYLKSARLSQLMVTDYKIAGVDRPGTSASGNPNTGIGTVTEGGKAILDNVEAVGRTVKKKVGSWYRRRVKVPVEQLSQDLGLPFMGNNPNTAVTGRNAGAAQQDVVSENAFSTSSEVTDASDNIHQFELGTSSPTPEPPQEQQGQNEFEDLRRVVKQGGDFCKDLAAVLQERSELEAQYAKGLSKLSAKLLKASKEATGSVAHAWQAVAVQIDTQAELHRLWSTAVLDEVAKPLKTSTETQHKIRKSVEVLVEKTTRNLAEWRTAEAKAKRHCFAISKEFEKLQETSTFAGTLASNAGLMLPNGTATNNASTTTPSTVNNNTTNSVLAEVRARSRLLSVPPVDKDPIKLEAKRRKAEEAVRRADIEYYTFCVRTERARLEWEGSIRNGSTCLRTLEEEKLGLLQELAAKYFQHLNEFIPKLVRSAESLEEPIKSCSVDQDMHSIVDIRRHAGVEQLLPDFYAEDTSNLMKKERRLEALQKFVYIIKQDLERERKGAVGIENLAKAVQEAPKIDNAHHDISDKLYYMKSMLVYLEGSRCKIENALADQEGRQRSNKTITQYMRHQRDKQGLPQTILKIPSWARDECLTNCSSSGSAGSLSPDWNERDRGAGDGNSHQHDTDFDEFSSEGSEHNIEVFEEVDSSKAKPVDGLSDDAPSIGRARVIYDYDSNMFDELTIRCGELINVHDKQEDGWWLGELNGVVGIFPATYVEELTD